MNILLLQLWFCPLSHRTCLSRRILHPSSVLPHHRAIDEAGLCSVCSESCPHALPLPILFLCACRLLLCWTLRRQQVALRCRILHLALRVLMTRLVIAAPTSPFSLPLLEFHCSSTSRFHIKGQPSSCPPHHFYTSIRPPPCYHLPPPTSFRHVSHPGSQNYVYHCHYQR